MCVCVWVHKDVCVCWVAVDLCSLSEAICHIQLKRRRVEKKVHMRDGGQKKAVTHIH